MHREFTMSTYTAGRGHHDRTDDRHYRSAGMPRPWAEPLGAQHALCLNPGRYHQARTIQQRIAEETPYEAMCMKMHPT
jgi:hypothetical protein